MKRFALCGLCVVALLAGCAPSADELRERGTSEFQVGRLAQAKAFFQRVLDRHPSDAESLYYMGRICQAEGRPDRAHFYYECCLDSDPRHQEARRWLAKAEQDMGPNAKDLRFLP